MEIHIIFLISMPISMVCVGKIPTFFYGDSCLASCRSVMFSSDVTIFYVAPQSVINILLSYFWFGYFTINSS